MEGRVFNWSDIHTLIFDFDGIFTDNRVIVDQNGLEAVICNRADSLGINYLLRFKELNKWNLDLFILSTEKNTVVQERAKKLEINCYSGISDKRKFIEERVFRRFPADDSVTSGIVFLGNDLNDLPGIDFAKWSFAPSDSHPLVQSKVSRVLAKKGGEGFVREFIELLIPEAFIEIQ